MNPSHPGVPLRPIGPIGVVATPGPSGPVGIGIGVPLLSGPPMQFSHHPSQKKLLSPDSSDDNENIVAQLFAQNRSSPNNGQNHGTAPNAMSWTNGALLSTSAASGMAAYPVMGMGVMGHAASHGLPDASVLYGLIGTAATASIPNSSNMSIPQPNVVLGFPSGMGGDCGADVPVSNNAPQHAPQVQIHQSDLHSHIPHASAQASQQSKEILHCKSCTLFPPNPTAPPPTTREKPPGCRTVFVGGLPEKMTEDMIREIFEPCGEITTIRMSKKNFCHIRFELERCIEAAIALSGYRIRVGSNSDPANIGRLHVDYAQARDDLYEFECRQRQLLREQRHRERIEKERLMPPSPPTIISYSDHEASVITENIKSDDTFIKGIHVLVAWLERGDCVKRNSQTFYSMIQSTNSHIRRLLCEKSQYEDELQKAKELMRQRMTGLLLQFSQIEKVFVSASHKKAWDHFSKAQRKNIEIWKKQTSEIKAALLEEALAVRNDEEMDLSDSEIESGGEMSQPPIPAKKMKWDDKSMKNVINLREENDSLRCQLEASNNEVDMMKADLKSELEAKDAQLKALQLKICEQQTLLDQSVKIREISPTCHSAENVLEEDKSPEHETQVDIAGQCDSSSFSADLAKFQNNQTYSDDPGNNQREGANQGAVSLTETDARLIGIVSTFLHVHPFGASLDYIWSYTQKVLPHIVPSRIESLLSKFPNLFRLESSGVGATLERKWTFVGFGS